MLNKRKNLILRSGETLIQSPHAVFRYELANLTMKQAKTYNFATDQASNIERIIEFGGKLKFVEMKSRVFEKNLQRLDTLLPELVSEMLVGFYLGGSGRFEKLVSQLAESNALSSELGFALDESFYQIKLKQLLLALALGMLPTKVWVGSIWAYDTCKVVLSSGHSLAYSAYKQSLFVDYLYKNARVEIPAATSIPSPNIVVESNKIFAELALEIRLA